MPAMNTSFDATAAEFRNRRRKQVKRAVSNLVSVLQSQEDITDDHLDQAISLLTEARRLSSSNPRSSPRTSPPLNINPHRRSASASDQYDQLTLWMRLRHATKPTKGYRVQYEGAWSEITPLGAINASFIHPNVSRGLSDTKLLQIMTDHLEWNSAVSPFISIFTDEQRAEDWALKWSEKNGGKMCDLLSVDCTKLTRLLSVSDIVKGLDLKTDMTPDQYEDEYVAVNQIPADAIVERRVIACPVIEAPVESKDPTSSLPLIDTLAPPVRPDEQVQRFSPVPTTNRRSVLFQTVPTDYLNARAHALSQLTIADPENTGLTGTGKVSLV